MKRARTTEVAKAACPHCGYVVEAATSLQGDHVPAPGSVTVCLQCAGVSQYTPALTLVPFDAAKLDPKAADLVRRARALIGGSKPS